MEVEIINEHRVNVTFHYIHEITGIMSPCKRTKHPANHYITHFFFIFWNFIVMFPRSAVGTTLPVRYGPALTLLGLNWQWDFNP